MFLEISAAILVLLSLLGIADSTYLTLSHFSGQDVVCTVFDECDFVLTSSYSEIAGVPVALLGVIYYLLIFILSILLSSKKATEPEAARLMKILFISSIVGLTGSAYFVFLQLIIIKALCMYCMVSALLSTLVFVVSIIGFLKTRKTNSPEPTQ